MNPPQYLLPTVLALLLLHVPCIRAADWPQWRGPNRDGVVRGVQAPAKWPKTLREEWKVTVGESVSCPVVVGDRVYAFTRQKDDESVLCLDAASGEQKWRSEPYPAPYHWWPGEGNFSKGPRSTPTVAGGRVYTAGVSGVISCLETGTRKVLWRKQSKEPPPYGGPASPLVADGLCVVHVGCNSKDDGLTAFDAATGEQKWRVADGSRPGAGSPILAELAGEKQLVLFTSWNLRGVSPATGKTLWALKLDGSEKNSTPLLYKDLIIFADYKDRLRAIRLEKGEKGLTPKDVWQAHGAAPYMSTPVLDGDLLFGASVRGGRLLLLPRRSDRQDSLGEQRGLPFRLRVGRQRRGRLAIPNRAGPALRGPAERPGVRADRGLPVRQPADLGPPRLPRGPHPDPE